MRHPSRWISIQYLWAILIVAGVFCFVNTHPIRPHDFWWHIAVGREILETGQIPQTDSYSYTAFGAPYPAYQVFWLMEIALYSIYKAGGPALIVFFQSIIITGEIILVLITGWKQTCNWRAAAFGAGFAALLGMNAWNVRPQAISFLLGAVYLFLIQRMQNGGRFIWVGVFPVGMLIWVNSHGTFPIGLVFLCLWVGHEAWILFVNRFVKKQPRSVQPFLWAGGTLLVTLFTCLINPQFYRIIGYLHSMVGNSVIRNLVTEWAPPTFNSLDGGIFLSALLVAATILAISPRRPPFYHIASFLVMSVLGLITSRGIAWFGLAMGPILAEHSLAILSSLRGKKKSAKPNKYVSVLNGIIVGLILSLVVICLPWFKERLPFPDAKAGLVSRETPIKATEYILQTNPPGYVFNAMSFGSYLIWAAQPEYRVFVDGRIELYPLAIWQDYLYISNARNGWNELLIAYGVHTLMLSPTEQPVLIEAVKENQHWNLVYEDPAALIFVIH